MKKYAPRKVFILENGKYIEISYEELCRREENDPSYKDKFFIPLHGMIMEVDETAYRDFYKAKDRDEWVTCCYRRNSLLKPFRTDRYEIKGKCRNTTWRTAILPS